MAKVTLKKRPNGRWMLRWRTPDGKHRCKIVDRKVDAERLATSIEHSMHAGAYVDPRLGRRTFGDWWEKWTATRVDLRPSTRARDAAYARTHLLPAFGPMPLARIDHTAVQRWIADLSASGLAPATVVKAVQIMGKAMRGAVTARLIATDPTVDVALPRVVRDETRFLEPAEIVTLASEIDERYRAFVLLGAYGGLRLGELAGLRRSRLDLLAGKVRVAEIVVEVSGRIIEGAPKTRAGARTVPLPRSIVDELADHCAGLGPDDRVFPAPKGGPIRAGQFRQRFWRPATAAAGLDGLRIHDLRHTAVALWIAAGATPTEVARRAGHESVVTVLDRYGHLLPGAEGAVTDALDAIARGAAAPAGKVLQIRG